MSFTPLIVMVCGEFQFEEVKVMLDGETVPSVGSLELIPMLTFAVGSVLSTIVN